ncbi:MAG TPA: outer membrane beta-barrel protein [Burkholderiales bacterium]|jgi:hypothetical protein|nr:outer membrane beta-barrel protein [Burkholderiales bacterium]
MRFALALLGLLALPAFGQPIRGDSGEAGLQLFVVGAKKYGFEGGASARNDGGVGMGIFISRNLNDYFSIGLEGQAAAWDYRASVAPGASNAGAGYDTTGSMETAALRVNATWNLLSRRWTPFVTAGAGAIFLDTNLDSAPPANACWIYPWYGQVCGGEAPRGTLTRFTYTAGLGLRTDFHREQGFVRAYFGGEWIALSEATSSVGYVQARLDFGLQF